MSRAPLSRAPIALALAACASPEKPTGLAGVERLVPATASVAPLPGCGAAGPPALRPLDAGLGFAHAEAVHPTAEELPEGFDGDTFRGAFGGGVVAADLDRDGRVDLLFANGGGANALHWGEGGGRFSADAAAAAGLDLPDEDTAFLAPADVDGDGDLDLYLTGWQRARLFENLGDRSFRERTDVGIAPPEAYPGAAAWADFDEDGDLDLFAGTFGTPAPGFSGPEPTPSRLYRQGPAWTFTDVAPELIPYVPGEEGPVHAARWRDLDADGDLDLLQVNDFGATRGTTMIWENRGPGRPFVDLAPAGGLGTLAYPMGSAQTDLDGDGLLDMLFTDLGMMRLFRSTGPGSWVDVGATWGEGLPRAEADASWSAVELDLDGDGYEEIYVSFGPIEGEQISPEVPFDPEQPDRLFAASGAGDGLRLLEQEGIFADPQTGRGRGVAVADLNEDGVPDVVVNNIGGPPAVLAGGCTDHRRAWIRLRWPGSANVHAVGAEVRVEALGRARALTVHAGGPGAGSGQEPALHVGLGDADAIDQIDVRWPDGARSELTDLAAGSEIILTREGP